MEFANECEFGMHRGQVVGRHRFRAYPALVVVEARRAGALRRRFAGRRADRRLLRTRAVVAGRVRTAYGDDCGDCALAKSARSVAAILVAPARRARAGAAARCLRPLRAAAAANASWLDAQAGGLIDEACRERWRDLPEFDARDRENFRALCAPKGGAAAPALRATPRVARAVEDLLAHHLGRRPKAGIHLSEFVTVEVV